MAGPPPLRDDRLTLHQLGAMARIGLLVIR
jgi:hypothetical protein